MSPLRRMVLVPVVCGALACTSTSGSEDGGNGPEEGGNSSSAAMASSGPATSSSGNVTASSAVATSSVTNRSSSGAVSEGTSSQPLTSSTTIPSSATTASSAILSSSTSLAGGFVILEALQLDRDTVYLGETLQGTVTYINNTAAAVSIQDMVIAARPPGGTHAGGPYLDLGPTTGSITVQPGATRTLTATRTFSASDALGQWEAYPTYHDAAGTWHDGPSVFFTVARTSTSSSGSTVTSGATSGPRSSSTSQSSTSIATSGTPAKPDIALGINLDGISDWSTELFYKDWIKFGRTWNNGANGDYPSIPAGMTADQDGWPTNLGGGVAEMLWDRGNAQTTDRGDFVLLYDGDGTINMGGDVSNVVKNPGRITFTYGGGFMTLRITATTAGNHIRNIRMMRTIHEATFAENPWNPDFISRIASRFNTLRFMDKMNTNWSSAGDWSRRTTPSFYTWSSYNASWNQIPVEAMVDLCNRTGANPWFTIPHLATDEYVRNFATYVRDHLRADLMAYVEFSNECWNWDFGQAQWCARQGEAESINAYQFYGKKAAQVMEIWRDVFTGQQQRLVRVAGVQAGYGNAGQGNEALNSMTLNGRKTATYFDAVAIAPYFNSGGASGSVQSTLDACESDIDDGVPTMIGWHVNLINNLPVNDRGNKLVLIAYEGGQHLQPNGNTSIEPTWAAANRDARMGTLYTRYFDAWKAGGGQLFVHFSDIGRYSKWGFWGLLEHLDQTSSPKYDATLQWINDNPKWW